MSRRKLYSATYEDEANNLYTSDLVVMRFINTIREQGLELIDAPVVDTQPSLFTVGLCTHTVRAHVRRRKNGQTTGHV